MSIELILDAVDISLIAFSQHLHNMGGQIFTIFVITDAVAEAAVGLGILIALFRNKETVQDDQIDLLKWRHELSRLHLADSPVPAVQRGDDAAVRQDAGPA